MTEAVTPRPPKRFAKDNRMKLYPDDWQVKLTSGLVSAACLIAAMMLVGIDRFWPFMLSILAATIVGNVLWPFVCRVAEIGSLRRRRAQQNKETHYENRAEQKSAARAAF